MADDKLADLLKTQKSLTEWLEDIKHTDVKFLRQEDNKKRERLKVLNEVIGLPFEKPTQFEAVDLGNDDAAFATFLQERGPELCCLRLIPKKDGLPKLRMRGKSITDAYAWFKEQEIDPKSYLADFVSHPLDYSWATIFIVNRHGIQGEIIYGAHHQLTQGFHDDKAPSAFRYDFASWYMMPENDKALAYLQKLVKLIHVTDSAKQKELEIRLGATFVHDYLMGYFETADSSMGTLYIDYSKSLGEIYADMIIRTEQPHTSAVVTGQTGSAGKVKGKVFIVDPKNLNIRFPKDGILVCEVTTPDYVPLMQKAKAIVTDQGGILSHAAIVARELHKPCIVGTGNATKELVNGDVVIVDADIGAVTKVS